MNIAYDIANFESMVANLTQISGKEYEPVLRDQVGQLMGVCIRYTHSANVESITKSVKWLANHRADVEGGPKLTIGKNGKHWLLDSSTWDSQNWSRSKKATGSKQLKGKNVHGMTFHQMNRTDRHWSAGRWARYQSMLARIGDSKLEKEMLAKAAKSRGLTKDTWQQIANDAGTGDRTQAPGYVRNAGTFRGAPAPKIGSATTTTNENGCFIDIANASRLLVKGPSGHFRGSRDSLGGFLILQRAISTRATAFQHELENGVFNDIEGRTKRYPGIFTTHASA